MVLLWDDTENSGMVGMIILGLPSHIGFAFVCCTR